MKISVIVTSFNHEKYITQCLESILCQKGDFEMELIVGDDHSVDKTRSIAQEFERKYPEIITLLPLQPNLGITKNLKRCLDACSGDYIAICEGDDYWTDTRKLEKQKVFLDAHPGYSMCFSAIMIFFEERNRFEPHHDQLFLNKNVLTTEDLIEQNYIGNFSCCMYRTSAIRQLPPGIFDIFTVDWMFNIACSRIGDIGFIRDWMSVYRKHPQGAWAGREELGKLKELRHLIDVYNGFFDYEHNVAFTRYAIVVDNEIIRFQRNQIEQTNKLLTVKKIVLWNRLKDILKPIVRKARKLWNILRSMFFRILENSIQKARSEKVDLIIIDTVFPHPLSPFRLQEFTSYLNYFPNSLVLTNGEHLHLLKESKGLKEIISEFEQANPDLKDRVRVTTREIGFYQADLAYVTFLFNINVFLEALERKRIPFVFTLYPGGAFALNSDEPDQMLQRVFKSLQFKKVIVTQKVTHDYLLDRNFCSPEQIEFIYGVVTPLPALTNGADKKYFGFDKDILDICFVAHKYMERGVDKGYDIFIEFAKKIVQHHENIRFHVVGSFTKDDIPIEGLDSKITFYGLQKPEWFDEFYLDKDIILSPNIPFKLAEGYFDGFPTASCIDAGVRKVAMFCTDELQLNIKFTDGEDIVIIPSNIREIVDIVLHFYSNPAMLQKIAETGAKKIREIYSYENQIIPRIRILEKELEREGKAQDE
jgi:glycosyltransferase involved in cell wall biosynthesis